MKFILKIPENTARHLIGNRANFMVWLTDSGNVEFGMIDDIGDVDTIIVKIYKKVINPCSHSIKNPFTAATGQVSGFMYAHEFKLTQVYSRVPF